MLTVNEMHLMTHAYGERNAQFLHKQENDDERIIDESQGNVIGHIPSIRLNSFQAET